MNKWDPKSFQENWEILTSLILNPPYYLAFVLFISNYFTKQYIFKLFFFVQNRKEIFLSQILAPKLKYPLLCGMSSGYCQSHLTGRDFYGYCGQDKESLESCSVLKMFCFDNAKCITLLFRLLKFYIYLCQFLNKVQTFSVRKKVPIGNGIIIRIKITK